MRQQNKGLRPEALMEMWQASGLTSKIVFTLLMVLVIRFGSQIPMADLKPEVLSKLFSQGLLAFADMFTGGALAKFTILALGILPYINASIIMQLMTSVIPKLEEMQKEGGEAGRRQIAQITRYLTVILATVQGVGLSITFWRSNAIVGHPADGSPPVLYIAMTAATLVAGATFVMWIGEQMTEHGIGNGASLLIFIGIVAAIPNYAKQTYQLVQGGASNWFMVTLLVASYLLVIIAVVYASEGARKIPVQSAKKQVGNRIYGGRATYLPFRLNQGGVMPIIFASSVMMFPSTIASFAPETGFLKTMITYMNQQPWYGVIFVGMIVFFSFFYASLILNPQEIANNLKRYGSYIPGYRPGRPTAEYLEKILSRMTYCGAIFLAILVIFPMIMESITGITTLRGIGSTSILIMVGVAVDLFNQLQSHLLARQYEGFTT